MDFSTAYKNESKRINRAWRFGDRIGPRRQNWKYVLILSPKTLILLILLLSV
jgi:hypothetical protein